MYTFFNIFRTKVKLKEAAACKFCLGNKLLINIEVQLCNFIFRFSLSVNCEYTVLVFAFKRIKNVYSCRSNILFKVNVAADICCITCLIFSGKLYVIEAVRQVTHINCFTNNSVNLEWTYIRFCSLFKVSDCKEEVCNLNVIKGITREEELTCCCRIIKRKFKVQYRSIVINIDKT